MSISPFITRTTRTRSICAAFLLLVVDASAASAAPPVQDEWITTRTKIALWTASHVDSTAVHVDTAGGRVTLHGKVQSQEQRQKSESVAREIPGVTSVRNLLQVVPEAREKAVAIADDRIKEQVAKSLKQDTSLARSRITVKSVDKGAVLLCGTARDLFDYLRALDDVNDVPGVRRVDSEVKAAEHGIDYGKLVAGGAKNVALDDWITTATKIRLLADSNVPALEINVDTHRGVVTLFGIVPTSASRSAAESDARRVDGIKDVNNELEVVAGVDKALVDMKDDEIKDTLKMALKTDEAFVHVGVDVKNGVARLTGHVSSNWDRLQAAMVARASRGVRAVEDDLRLHHS